MPLEEAHFDEIGPEIAKGREQAQNNDSLVISRFSFSARYIRNPVCAISGLLFLPSHGRSAFTTRKIRSLSSFVILFFLLIIQSPISDSNRLSSFESVSGTIYL